MPIKCHLKLQVHFLVGSNNNNIIYLHFNMSRNAHNNKYGKVVKCCHQFGECSSFDKSGSFGNILTKLANPENALKLIMVAIVANLVILSKLPNSEKALQAYYGGDFGKFGNSGSFVKIAKL